jgi:anti-anti-sigma factor
VVLTNDEAQCEVRLSGELGIAGSTELKAILVEAISSGKKIVVDLEQAADVDVTGVQLLWAAAREAKQKNLQLTFARASDALRSAARDMGFDDFLTAAAGSAAESSALEIAKSADD